MIGLYIIIILMNVGFISTADWDSPVFSKPKNFPCKPSTTFSKDCEYWDYTPASETVTVNIEEELKIPIVIAYVHCIHCEEYEPQIGTFEVGSRVILGPVIKKVEIEKYEIIIENRLDYEIKEQQRFEFELVIEDSSEKVHVQINVVDIDDNPPRIIVGESPCIIPENMNGESNCTYTVVDPDTIHKVTDVKFFFPEKYDTIFEFKITTPDATTEAKVVLKVLTPLDFETLPVFYFEVIAEDLGGNRGSAWIMITVQDMNDQPPRWFEIFAMKSFEENTKQKFTVYAKDGDLGINDKILYHWSDDKCHDKITLLPEGDKAVIRIKEIDRDTPEIENNDNTIKCILVASEASNDTYTADAHLTFIIEDINDNNPLITVNKTFQPEIILKEEQFANLHQLFSVNDIDQGNNAQFDVTLISKTSDDYTSPFQIIPTNGYRTWNFSMSIIKPELLDYDKNDVWREFSLQIHSIDKGKEPLKGKDKIHIKLKNLNDEIPYFDPKTEYTVKILENATKGAYILNVLALDDDVDDKVIYNLPTGINDYELKLQPNNSVTLYTTRDNVFDYEKIDTVFIQVTATDTLIVPDEPVNFHNITQQITIVVIDVNDEKPRLTLPYGTTNITEHSKTSTCVTNKITAVDVDTTAYLEFSINWTLSRASKLGVPVQDKSKFEGVLDIVTTFPDKNKTGYSTGTIVVKNNNTLDYEEFDTLFLLINVTDKNQEINDGTDQGTLTIIIDDINDNAPEFKTDTITSKKLVQEHSKPELKIATIVATDKDGPGNNEITYYLNPINGTAENLVKIDDESGDLVVESDKIDADYPKTYFLYYEVIASDKVYNTTEKIKITVDDINDLYPKLSKNLVNNITVDERKFSDPAKCIQKINGIDDDRDKPHNIVMYFLNNEITTTLSHMFSVNNETGEVIADGTIIWSSAQENITISIVLQDNYGGQGSPNKVTNTFYVIINDIDDNPPELPSAPTTIQTIYESDKIGTPVATIIATDKDKPCTAATEIDYSITEMLDRYDNKITKDIFEIIKKEENCKQIAVLTIKQSIGGYYGTNKITIRAENPGTKDVNFDEETYEINIEPSNLKEPSILIPKESKLNLQKKQKAGEILIAIDGSRVTDFEATDNQNGKFEMVFEKGSMWNNLFDIKIKPVVEKNKARLILTQDIPPEKNYKLTIKAQHGGNGIAPRFIEKNISLSFVDENEQPSFKETEFQVEFYENNTDVRCQTIPAAFDPKCDGQEVDCSYDTYYHIMNVTEQTYFKIVTSKKPEPQICLNKDLDREEQEYYYLLIVATNYKAAPQGIDNYEPLNLTVHVLDINDNPPSFESKIYNGGLADNDKIGSVIVTLEATDPDLVDQGKLRYEIIENSINVSHSSLEDIKYKTFEIKDNKIKNLRQPTQTMQGYFLFRVIVLDTLDYNDTAEVKIHIISEVNRITFIFNNDIDSVKGQMKNIAAVFSKELGYSCVIDDVAKKIVDGQSLSDQTEVKSHFISGNDEPVSKSAIEEKLEDLKLLGKLGMRFEDIDLHLMYEANTEIEELNDPNDLLRILLIVVTVVLGTLCIILIVAFILRTRSLNNRLKAVTTNVFGSTKSDLNRIGINAPGTNRHAIEANPVWNEDLKHVDQFDAISQTSGGSDLIGIEDKPDFEYDYRRASINPIIHENMRKISDQDDDIQSLPGQNNISYIKLN